MGEGAPVTTAALVHVVVSGLATGSIYALMALSLVIVYNATRTLNFAQGEMLMISTFVGRTALQVLRAPLVYRPLIFGAILVTSMLFMPGGIASALRKISPRQGDDA